MAETLSSSAIVSPTPKKSFGTSWTQPRAFSNGRSAQDLVRISDCRALSHQAEITEPKDLAWLLASYARDGLARVEAAGDTSSLDAVRSALEESLGVHFEGERGDALFSFDNGADVVLRRVSLPGCCGHRRRPANEATGSPGIEAVLATAQRRYFGSLFHQTFAARSAGNA